MHNLNNLLLYKAVNRINNKVYIGITSHSLEVRKKRHWYDRNKKSKFPNAISKYGINEFEWSEVACAFSWNDLKQLEIDLIAFYDSYNNGYNSTLGGDNPGVSKYWLGKKRSIDTIKKMHNGIKKKIAELGHGLNQGYRHTDKTKAIMSEKRKGKSPSNKGKKLSQQDINNFIKNNKSGKSIVAINLESGVALTFSSIKNAAKELLTTRETIKNSLNKKRINKKYIFMYVEGNF